MPQKFITSAEGNKRLADLRALIVAKGETPKEVSAITSQEFASAISTLEAQLASLPTAAERLQQTREAVAARLEASKLALQAQEAKARAKALVTAESFRQSIAKPTITRAEFAKLTHPERNALMRKGGVVITD